MKMKLGLAESGAVRDYATDRQRWEAIIRRDPGADGQFFYSVRTTGIYCRPTCGARPAKRENVEFHLTCEAAERAGFRACKRCRPDATSPAEDHAAKVAAACRTIETAEESPGLATLAAAVGMSRFHFHRVFTRVVGLTPKAYAAAHRADRIRRALPRRATVTEAIYEAGFNSNSRFYSKAPELLGMAPAAFRKGAPTETIRFAIKRCSLGAILVASSEQGICMIALGNDPEKLRGELGSRFQKARLVGGDARFEQTVARVVAFVDAPRTGLKLPLDIRGTAFQRRVWDALRRIPSGETLSYAELAARIDAPASIRAVGSACAANPIAVAIPCHRVVGSDGGLSGYRWGLERKRALLKKESQMREGDSQPATLRRRPRVSRVRSAVPDRTTVVFPRGRG